MSDLDFFQHLQFKLSYAPFDPDDDELEKWRKKNRIIDDEIQKAGINNPQLVRLAKETISNP